MNNNTASNTPSGQSTVTIVGAGMMGSALAFPARENGHTVRIVGTHLDRGIIEGYRKTGKLPKFSRSFPEGVEYYDIEDLERALEGADLLIGGVSSFGVDWFAENVLPLIPETLSVLSVTKGLIADEKGVLITYPEYWKRKLAPKKLCLNAVGGPCTSYELVAHDPTVVSFCGEDLEVLRRLKKIMETDYYHIEITTDVAGVECAVALKNAYALGVAIAVGMNEKANGTGIGNALERVRSYAAADASEKINGADVQQHYNSQAGVFGQSAREMQKLLRLLAGSDRSLHVGIGDLYVTVFSGRTRLLGTLLGLGLTLDETLRELSGITLESNIIIQRMARALRDMAGRGEIDLADFPLMARLGEVLLDGRQADIPWEDFVVKTESLK
jgi:glycerol-3-phosphate dehydrogenase (NAD(P)+)